MKLKEVVIHGFKSFGEKTRIEFADGMTAIVGPNGCGKSNIVDAIKWGMGDRSPKSLRGESLQDVIFAGSKNHPPMGMAEVSLLFDNSPSEPTLLPTSDLSQFFADLPSENHLPTHFKNLPSIQITRRLHRDGPSEYLINKTPCRLRDIEDLLSGSGVGKAGYAIIEQNQIGFIVTAKPAERRLLIDEASGLTRYNTQRERTERNIEKSQENIERVNDLISELDSHITLLHDQALAAASFRTLNNSLREASIALLLCRTRTLCDQIQSLQKQRLALQTQLDSLQTTLVNLMVQIQQQSLDQKDAQLLHQTLTEQSYAIDTSFALTNDRLHNTETTLKHQSLRAEELRKELAGLRRDNDRLTELSQTLELQAVDPQALNEYQARIEAATVELRTAKEHLSKAQAEQRQLVHDHDRTLSQITLLEQRIQLHEERTLEGAHETKSLSEQLLQLDEEHSQIHASLEALEWKEEHLAQELEKSRDTVALFEKEKRQQIQELTQLEARHRTQAKKTLALQAKRDTLANQLAEHTLFPQDLRRVMQAAEHQSAPGTKAQDSPPVAFADRLSSLVADVSPPEEHPQILRALTHELHDLIVPEAATARRLYNDALRTQPNSPLRITFAIAPDPDHYIQSRILAVAPLPDSFWNPPSLNNPHTNTPLHTDPPPQLRNTHTISTTEKDAKIYVSNDAILLSPNRLLMGHQQGEEIGERLLTLKADHDALCQELETTQEEEHTLNDTILEKEERLQATSHMELQASSNLEQLTTQHRELQHQLADLQRTLKQANQTRTTLHHRLERLTATQTTAQDQAQHLQLELQHALTQLTDLQTRLAELPQHDLLAQESISALDEQITNDRMEYVRLEERSQSIQREKTLLAERLQENTQRLVRTDTQIQTTDEQVAHLEVQLDTLQEELAQSEENRTEKRLELIEAKERLEAVEVALQSAEMARTRIDDETRQVHDQIQALLLEEARLETEHHALEEERLQTFPLPLAEAEALVDQLELRLPEDLLRSRIHGLKSQIGKLGDINHLAEADYNAARERHDFLTEQREDLELTIEELTKALRSFDRESRRLFKRTFHEVDRRFQVVFPKLFRGGSARLRLTDPDDLLSSGVDIEVVPPGKRPQSITLLSGGEKALTAASLVFALFLLRPTPFAFLDEVDAPLDEGNIGRYALMVRELSKTSQMIVITHSRRSMEFADRLHGVVMQEPGVSKVVTVELSQGEPNLLTDPTSIRTET